MRLLALVAAPLLLGSTPDEGRWHYVLDSKASNVDAKVAFFLLASKTAHFPRASGTISLAPDRLDAVDLEVTLDARALTAPDSLTLSRLKGPKFFDVAHYPTLRFSGHKLEMTGATTANLSGEVTARGVTRPIMLSVSFNRSPFEAVDGQPLELKAQVDINRDDFGMTAYHFIVGRTVSITINAKMVPS